MVALQKLTSATGFTPQMLYLCAIEAQDKGKKELGCEVLKKIVRDWDETWMTDQDKEEIRLPTIFRYLIQGGTLLTTDASSDLRTQKQMEVKVQMPLSLRSYAVNLKPVSTE